MKHKILLPVCGKFSGSFPQPPNTVRLKFPLKLTILKKSLRIVSKMSQVRSRKWIILSTRIALSESLTRRLKTAFSSLNETFLCFPLGEGIPVTITTMDLIFRLNKFSPFLKSFEIYVAFHPHNVISWKQHSSPRNTFEYFWVFCDFSVRNYNPMKNHSRIFTSLNCFKLWAQVTNLSRVLWQGLWENMFIFEEKVCGNVNTDTTRWTFHSPVELTSKCEGWQENGIKFSLIFVYSVYGSQISTTEKTTEIVVVRPGFIKRSWFGSRRKRDKHRRCKTTFFQNDCCDATPFNYGSSCAQNSALWKLLSSYGSCW